MKNKRLKGCVLCAFMLASAFAQCTSAENSAELEGKKVDWDTPFRPAVSLGLSRPLLFSVSAGLMLTLGPQDQEAPFPTSPALRADGELGVGGGSVDVGLFIPHTSNDFNFSVSLKAERMRTWLLNWDQPRGALYNGFVVELAALGAPLGGGPKIGMGSFRDTSQVGGTRHSFTYLSIGLGW